MIIKMDINNKDNNLNYEKMCFFSQNSPFLIHVFFCSFKKYILLLEVWFIE